MREKRKLDVPNKKICVEREKLLIISRNYFSEYFSLRKMSKATIEIRNSNI
jgi:hypothetical protein